MDYAQYVKMKEDFEAEYRKNLEALELVWKRTQAMADPSHQNTSPGENSGVSISDSIRKVVSGFGDNQFNADAIQQALKDHSLLKDRKNSRLSITNTLHRLARRGELEVVKKGQGRMPSTYKRKISTGVQE